MKLIIIPVLLAFVGVMAYSCQSESEIEYKRYYSAGQQLYKTRCQNCHGATGEGLAALIPPLTDSAYLKKNSSQLSCFLQNGLQVPILVNGKAYTGQMPPANLAPVEAAQVITYIKNSFGNQLGLHSVDQVNRELKTCN